MIATAESIDARVPTLVMPANAGIHDFLYCNEYKSWIPTGDCPRRLTQGPAEQHRDEHGTDEPAVSDSDHPVSSRDPASEQTPSAPSQQHRRDVEAHERSVDDGEVPRGVVETPGSRARGNDDVLEPEAEVVFDVEGIFRQPRELRLRPQLPAQRSERRRLIRVLPI